MRRAAEVAVALIGLACPAVAACASSSGDGTPAIVESNGIAVLDAWTRPTPTGSQDAAIYVTLELRDGAPDRLVGADSDRCMVMHPHLTEIDDHGVAAMGPADDELALTPGEQVTMKPNGLHLMCLGVTEPLAAGDTFDVELHFGDHPTVVTPVTVENR